MYIINLNKLINYNSSNKENKKVSKNKENKKVSKDKENKKVSKDKETCKQLLTTGIFWFHRRIFDFYYFLLKKANKPIMDFTDITSDKIQLYEYLIQEFNQLDTISIPEDFSDELYLELVTNDRRNESYKKQVIQFSVDFYSFLKKSKNLNKVLNEKDILLLGPMKECIEIEKNGVLKQLFNHTNENPYFKICPFKHEDRDDLEYSQKLNMIVINKFFYSKDILNRKICLFWPINGCSVDDSLDPGFKHLYRKGNLKLLIFKKKFKKLFLNLIKFYNKYNNIQKIIFTCIFHQSIGLYLNLSKSNNVFKDLEKKSIKIPSKPFVNYNVNVMCKSENNVNCLLENRVFLTHEKQDLGKNSRSKNRVYPTFMLDSKTFVPIPNITALEFIEIHKISNGNFYFSLDFPELLIFTDTLNLDETKFIKLKANIITRRSINKKCIIICDEKLCDINYTLRSGIGGKRIQSIHIWDFLEQDNTELITYIYENIDNWIKDVMSKKFSHKKSIKIINLLSEQAKKINPRYFNLLVSTNESNINTRNTVSRENNTSFGNFNKKKNKRKSKKTQNTSVGSKSQGKQQSTNNSSNTRSKPHRKRQSSDNSSSNNSNNNSSNSSSKPQRQLQSSNNSSNTHSKPHRKRQSSDNSSNNNSNNNSSNSSSKPQRQLQSSNNSSNTRSKTHKKRQSFVNSSTNSSNARLKTQRTQQSSISLLKSQGKQNKDTESNTESQYDSDTESQYDSDTESQYNSDTESQYDSDTESQYNSDTESQYDSDTESQYNSDTESQSGIVQKLVKKTKKHVKTDDKVKYKNRLYRVHIGPNGGRYIICNKSKKYI